MPVADAICAILDCTLSVPREMSVTAKVKSAPGLIRSERGLAESYALALESLVVLRSALEPRQVIGAL